MGFRYDRSPDNTPVLKMLVPNMLRLGRINSRALEGPVRLSSDNRMMLKTVQDIYEAWYRVWCETYVPKLLVQKTGFKSSRDLAPNDIVYFQKKQSEISSPWSMGRIDNIVRGRDGYIRKAFVKYRNANEEIDRITDRSTRRLIKLYSEDDADLQVDLSKLQARIEELQDLSTRSSYKVQVSGTQGFEEDGKKLSCQCCCKSHCKVAVHNLYGTKTHFASVMEKDVMVEFLFAQLDDMDVELVEEDEDHGVRDHLTGIIMDVGRDLF